MSTCLLRSVVEALQHCPRSSGYPWKAHKLVDFMWRKECLVRATLDWSIWPGLREDCSKLLFGAQKKGGQRERREGREWREKKEEIELTEGKGRCMNVSTQSGKWLPKVGSDPRSRLIHNRVFTTKVIAVACLVFSCLQVFTLCLSSTVHTILTLPS